MTTYAPETHRHRVHAPWLIAVAVLAAVLVALVAVGCGGGSKTLTKEEYGRQLNQICADLEAKEREIGEVNTIPEFVAKQGVTLLRIYSIYRPFELFAWPGALLV